MNDPVTYPGRRCSSSWYPLSASFLSKMTHHLPPHFSPLNVTCRKIRSEKLIVVGHRNDSIGGIPTVKDNLHCFTSFHIYRNNFANMGYVY